MGQYACSMGNGRVSVVVEDEVREVSSSWIVQGLASGTFSFGGLGEEELKNSFQRVFSNSKK